MKRPLTTRQIITGVLALAIGFALLVPMNAQAAFVANRIIDDAVFTDYTSMNAGQIDSFLNQFTSSCISTNRGFLAPKPIGYTPSGGYTYGGNGTAGEVIAASANAYGLNPKALLVTLQKEQSLVVGDAGCSTLRYTGATGYGCPDSGTTHSYSGLNLYTLNGITVTSVSGTCVNSASKAGFSQQVIRAAWLLRFGQERSKGNADWAIIKPGWDNSDDPQSCYGGPMTEGTFRRCPSGSATYYDGYQTIDGSSVHMDNGATAALYWYTPHFHGNQNFVSIWESWWGTNSTNVPQWRWEKTSMKIWDEGKNVLMGTDQLRRGERLFVEVTAKNTGNQMWWRDHTNQARLGVQYPNPHKSEYCDREWIWCSRAAVLKEASVAPGETGHFEFYIHAPNQGGVFREWFEPVLDGLSWMDNDQGFNIYVNSTNEYDWHWLYFDAYTDSSKTTPVSMDNLARNQEVYIELKVRNSSATVWTNSGQSPTRLGMQRPQDHNSFLCTGTWVSCNRAANISESSVVPGGVGTFAFTNKAPGTTGVYREYVKPVVELKGWMRDDPNHIYLNVTH